MGKPVWDSNVVGPTGDPMGSPLTAFNRVPTPMLADATSYIGSILAIDARLLEIVGNFDHGVFFGIVTWNEFNLQRFTDGEGPLVPWQIYWDVPARLVYNIRIGVAPSLTGKITIANRFVLDLTLAIGPSFGFYSSFYDEEWLYDSSYDEYAYGYSYAGSYWFTLDLTSLYIHPTVGFAF